MTLIQGYSLPLKYVHVQCATVSVMMCVIAQVLNVRDNALKDSGLPPSMFHLQELVTLVSFLHTHDTYYRYMHPFICKFAETFYHVLVLYTVYMYMYIKF